MKESHSGDKDKGKEKNGGMEGPQTSSQASLLISANFHQKQSSEMKSSMSSKNEPSNKDDLLCDDILSCISALDEVIAEFDDCSSLPYPIDAETFASFVESTEEKSESFDNPIAAAASSSPRSKSNSTTTIQVGSSECVSTAAMLNRSNSSQRHHPSSQTSFIPSAISSHIPSPMKSNQKQQMVQQVSQSSKSANMPKGREENYPQIHKTSHLIHVSGSSPCSSSTSSSSSSGGGPRAGISKPHRKSIPVACSNVNVNGDGGRRSSGTDQETLSEIDIQITSNSGSTAKSGSDTYSKGTSYNVLLPNAKPNAPGKLNSKSIIHNNPFVSSSRNHNNNIRNNSNGVSGNSQLTGSNNLSTKIIVGGAEVGGANGSRNTKNGNVNIFNSGGVEEELGGVALTLSGSVPKVKGRGQMTTPMSVTQNLSHVQNSIRTIPTVGHCDKDLDFEADSVMKEQWNFPSEKNLPRSLRKTRKTCLLDEDEENGPPSSPGPGIQHSHHQPWTRNNGKYTDNEDEFCAAPVSKRSNFIGNSNVSSNEQNCKGKNGRDDRRKIYEEVVVNQEASHSQPKTNGNGVSTAPTAKPQYFNAPLVLHIEDQCRNERKSPPQQQQQFLTRNKDSVSINIASKNQKNGEEEFENCKSNIEIGKSSMEMKTNIAYNIPIHDLNKSRSVHNGSGAIGQMNDVDIDSELVNKSSQSVIIVNKSKEKSGTVNGINTNGSCGSGRSSGRSSVNSDNNNSMSTGTGGAGCCNSNGSNNNSSVKLVSKQMSGINVETNNKSVVSMNINGSGSSSSSSGIGMTRGRIQQMNGKSGNGSLGALLACSASSSSSGGSASGSTAVLDVDDGYLSMINRNEAQILWPDEMIENETFTADELKRISVNLGEDVQLGAGKSGHEEKMDYFSDDSLELEPDGCGMIDGSQGTNLGSQGIFSMAMSGDTKGMVYSAIPYKRSSERGSRERRVRSGCGGGGGSSGARFFNNVSSDAQSPPGSSPSNLLQYSVVSVAQEGNYSKSDVEESAASQSEPSLGQETSGEQGGKKGRHYVSRIPKIAKGHEPGGKSDSGHSASGSGSCSPAASLSLRKPCSFFIPLTDTTPAGATTAEVKTPARLMRQLTHEIRVENNPDSSSPTASPCSSDGQTSAVDKDNATANHSSSSTTTTKINSSGGTAVRDTDIRQPITFLSSTSSPDLSSSDILPSTGALDDSAESAPSLSSKDLFQSPLSLTSINHFVQEIMETALKSGFDEASINTNHPPPQTNRDNSPDHHQHTPSSDINRHTHSVKESSAKNSRSSCGEESRELFTSSNARTRTPPHNSNEADIKVSADRSNSSEREIVSSEGCQVRLQVEEIDEPTEPQVDHDHRDKQQHRKNQIETVARLQAAVTTFFTTNENFFSENKRFPAGTPTPTDHSEDTTANRSPSPLSLPTSETDFSPLSPEFTDVPLMNSTRISLVLDSVSSPTDVEPENEAFNQNSQKMEREDYINTVEVSNGSPVMTEPYSFIEDLNEQPPAFIPTPPPELAVSTTNGKSTGQHGDSQANSTETSSEPVRKEDSRTLSHPEDSLPLPRMFNGSGGINNKNIWPGYDRHFGGELLNAKPCNGKSLSSRSQENLLDAVTKERLEKAFATRGQASTLPLNCRPPTSQRRASTFRNMFNKFRRNKHPEQTIPEVPELKDEEVQSITSRDSRKKPGFFSRLFRRSRKH